MATSNAHNKQIPRGSAQAHRQALVESLQARARLARRNGDIPAQQALYREAVALGLPLDCLDPHVESMSSKARRPHGARQTPWP